MKNFQTGDRLLVREGEQARLADWESTGEGVAYKGLFPKVVDVTSNQARRACGLNLIFREMELVEEWLRTISAKVIVPVAGEVGVSNLSDKALVKGLWRAAIITYAKAFENSKGRGANLGIEHVPEDLRKTHRSILQIRNKFVAHSDGDMEGGFVQRFEVNHPEDGTQRLLRIKTHQTSLDISSLNDFAKIVAALASVLPNEIQAILNSLE